MRTKRAKWLLCLLATVLNVGGGPMAWARVAGTSHCHEAVQATATMPADCSHHGMRHNSAPSHPSPHMPCCAGGSCACAVVQSMPGITRALLPATIAAPVSEALRRGAPADIIDDALRPPIA